MSAALDRLEQLDHRLLLEMRTRGHADPRVERLVSRFSQTGENAASWLLLGAAGYLLSEPGGGRRRAWQRGLVATTAGWGLNTAIKQLVRRKRPTLEGLPALTPVISQLSFPSAHSTAAFAGATAYSRALPWASPLLYGVAAAYAVSRPYLGVHHPSDVVAGAALGAVVGSCVRAR